MAVALLGILLLLILMSVPIAFSIGISSLFVILMEGNLTPWIMIQRTFGGLDSFVILAIPLFLLTGEVMNRAGITDELIDFSSTVVGHIRGGLAHINVFVSMIFAGISGSSTADTAGIGKLLIPAMIKRGYSKEFTVAVTAASSTLGQIIPPSIIAVIYAATVGISVGALFLGGAVPGILIGLAQMVVSYIFARKYNYPAEERSSFRKILHAFKKAILPMLSPVLLIGGIIGGIFTATEAAVVSAVYSILIAIFVYRSIKLKELWDIFVTTALNASVTIFCIAIAAVFGYLLAYFHVPEMLGSVITQIASGPVSFLLIVILLFLIVGTFMDATPAIIILAPMLAPIACTFGVNPIHLGVIIVLTLALGLITPPYGLCLLVAAQIANIPVNFKLMRTMSIFILVSLLIIILIALFPDIALFIPKIFAPKMMGVTL
ncbi:TRAP dicarboxylate transporter, DctM subunit [uncultured spirochete]|jgi:C4-dicarboxylate transporter DctM subunit|uniref:TRAP dicarboxylate transporter, DctM subunit n=1 Tax=uncultured spirochete TaxID=156406 RepID=A0A3P3XQI8_9SPIR|nr:TRAP dicarboxylate transporter, DctM subunit [uncultured spirochete]